MPQRHNAACVVHPLFRRVRSVVRADRQDAGSSHELKAHQSVGSDGERRVCGVGVWREIEG